MKMINNPAIARMASEIGCDYLFALGLFAVLSEMEKAGMYGMPFDERTVYTLGYMSTEMSTRLSTELSTKIWDIYGDIMVDIKRDKERDKKRTYRERKKSAPSSPLLPPTPPINPLLSPEKKESGVTPPLSLRERPPEGAHIQKPRFSPPAVDEVRAYADEKGYKDFDADRFVDFYASKNWMVGKNKMSDWRAACRNWQARRNENVSAQPRAAPKNPALDYRQREYRDEQFGDDFFVDLSKYGE